MSVLAPEFTQALCGAYADFLRRQRPTANAALLSWPTSSARRAPEFTWIGSLSEPRERVMWSLDKIHVGPTNAAFPTLKKIAATISLNPYEREALYGYPFVVGKQGTRVVRAPLLLIPISIVPEGNGFTVAPTEDRADFNPLPFLSDVMTDARELALTRLVEHLPELPLTKSSFAAWMADLKREIDGLIVDARLDGSLTPEPVRPRGPGDYLEVIDQAAVVLASQASYFLVSDLEKLASEAHDTGLSCLGPLLGGAGDERQVDVTAAMEAKARIAFPFPANRAQRRVAILVDDPTTRVVRIDGPPGTGKSLTIANLVAHLAAEGKSVLVTSQKDKALEVVDEKLRSLDNPLLPMTLLRRNKQPLLDRLMALRKTRSKQEVDEQLRSESQRLEATRASYNALSPQLMKAVDTESVLSRTDRETDAKTGLPRIFGNMHRRRVWRRAAKGVPRRSDVLSEEAGTLRAELSRLALETLRVSSEAITANETRAERQNREDLAKVVKRNQSSYKNFSLFERLKQDSARAASLLKSLPAWVMPPDDVARLFPCTEGLFDVVIVDEASQVDLPSILPILFRGKKIVICGDFRQMQPKRFAFANDNIARAAWQKHGVRRYDPDEFLYPTRQSLLELAQTRAEESVFLDEHFRSLPSIITFSNDKWYGSEMRIMTDESRKKFGAPTTGAITLHRVNGLVETGSQVNEIEGQALVGTLKAMLSSPDYDGASFGVLCLFQEQVEYIQHLVEDTIDEKEWEGRGLVVLNPDGMQGDERDVILYSLSYDAQNMTQQQLSPRLQQSIHIQGMLNVAFTRPRDEVHVFHSAPIEEFGFAGGRPSAVSEWLAHGRDVMTRGRVLHVANRAGKVDSQFETDVADSLGRQGFEVSHQYRACGFWIDLVIEHQAAPGRRLAVECDGEPWHTEPDGSPKLSDLEREEILERAGWKLLRIPYSGWRKHPERHVNRVKAFFFPEQDLDMAPLSRSGHAAPRRQPPAIGAVEKHVISVVGDDVHDEYQVAKRVATKMGYARLGPRIRRTINAAAATLVRHGLLAIEEGDWYLTSSGRALAQPSPKSPTP